jgi:hypothetical protein
VNYGELLAASNAPYLLQRRAIMKWRERSITSVLVVLVLLLIFAFDGPQPCPDIGGIPVKYTCYYHETITAINQETKELRSKVDKSVIEGSRGIFDYLEMLGYEEKAHKTHVFHVENDDISTLKVGDSYRFVSKPGRDYPKRCTTDDCKNEI